ncbi:MAG: SDR family oxidoreductase [candidate division Zixibacteria bacterium]|nr:SDR family oxidoreductase [candidate division Zixibacteria bacterium]
MVSLNGRIVLITGASAGIGAACARSFATAGARLILAARRTDRLKQLAAQLNTEVYVQSLDVRNHSAVKEFVAALPEEWRAIEILVNNAGLAQGFDKLHEGEIDDWETMIDTNVKGLLYVSRAVIPGMVERGRGHVINIGSIAGHEVYPGGNVYCATKHAVDGLTKGMRIDLVDTPVRVSTVDPGLVETEFALVRFHGDQDQAKGTYQGYKPLEADDIADAVVWVASRPDHVQVAEVIMLPAAQASCMVLDKKE